MVSSAATTVEEYLASLAEDRRAAISAVRDVVNANLPAGFEEGMQYGMIGWYIPLARKPDTYNKQPLGLAALASQKNHMALYLMTVYSNRSLETWFRKAFADAGKKLDMGKSCVRFTNLEALPLAVIGETITKVSVDDYIAHYDRVRPAQTTSAKKPSRKPAKKKLAAKSAMRKPAKKASAKKPSAKKSAKNKRR